MNELDKVMVYSVEKVIEGSNQMDNLQRDWYGGCWNHGWVCEYGGSSR